MTKGPENELKKKIKVAIDSIDGCKVISIIVGLLPIAHGRFVHGAVKGTPDILVMLPRGQCVWLEVKTEKGALNDNQEEWFRWAQESGHKAFIVRDVESAVAVVTAARDRALSLSSPEPWLSDAAEVMR